MTAGDAVAEGGRGVVGDNVGAVVLVGLNTKLSIKLSIKHSDSNAGADDEGNDMDATKVRLVRGSAADRVAVMVTLS